jgi:AraC-like DNA-binding protein
MRNNLLLILHDKQERHALYENLQPAYNIFEVSSKEETRQVFEVISIQLIICAVDEHQPDGWEICTELKSSLAYSHIPVIMMAHDESMSAKIKSLEAGADAYVGATYNLKYLQALIKSLIVNRAKVVEHITSTQIRANNHPDLMRDDDFIKKLNAHITCHLHNSSLSVDLLARMMNMSRPTLYRKIRTMTDLTPNDLIHVARLKQAAALLAAGDHKVFEVAKMVGFQSQSSFGKAFIKQFKLTPTQYLQKKKREAGHNETWVPANSIQHDEGAVFYS